MHLQEALDETRGIRRSNVRDMHALQAIADEMPRSAYRRELAHVRAKMREHAKQPYAERGSAFHALKPEKLGILLREQDRMARRGQLIWTEENNIQGLLDHLYVNTWSEEKLITPQEFCAKALEASARMIESLQSRITDFKPAGAVCLPIWRGGLVPGIAFAESGVKQFVQLGMMRDEQSLTPSKYFDEWPESDILDASSYLVIADPMLATGGTFLSAIESAVERGIPEEDIIVFSMVSAIEGIDAIFQQHPFVTIVTGCRWGHLDRRGYIIPAVGDFGDQAADVTYDERVQRLLSSNARIALDQRAQEARATAH